MAVDCTEAPRPPPPHKLTVQQPSRLSRRWSDGAARPCSCGLAVWPCGFLFSPIRTRQGRRVYQPDARYCRQPGRRRPICAGAFSGAAPGWRGHSCLRTSTRADRNVCPTLPRSIAAASRDGVAPSVLARLCRSDPVTRRQATTACIWQTDALFHDYIPPLQG